MQTATLSKSSFGSGQQCHKRLWIEKHNPELVPETAPSQQAIFDQGHEVGSWSHRLFPDGILLSGELDFEGHLRASRDALAARKSLFEPAFAIPGAYARADILVPVDSDGWDLLEVKSSSNVWEDDAGTQIKAVYLQDIAFQLYVYRQAGLNIRKAYLVFLNRDYVRQGDIDPQQLFRRVEVTMQTQELLPSIPIQTATLAQMLQGQNSPDLVIGPHCHRPYECSLINYCWKNVPKDSVFTLVRAGAKAWKWWNNGVIRVADLPPTEQYSSNQLIQIAAERTQELHLDVSTVLHFLEGLRYPLHFLDFETLMPAVPMFDGCRPYAQVPFQFSLHIQKSPSGEVTHLDYLADGSGDPRPGFLQALQASFDTEGSIVSYNSSFETLRLRELATQFPDHAAWINQALVRFENADLLQPFRSFAIYHPEQHGSASIKSVLPAFTDLGYDDLTIQEGGIASNQFLRLLKGLVPTEEISGLRENLLNYCKRDTLAMIKLVECMKALSVSKRESLVAKVIASGFFEKEEIAQFPDNELEMAIELIEKRESVLDPDTGFMDSDDFTEVMGCKPVGRFSQSGKHTVTELKNATSFVHGEAVKQAPHFLLDLETATHHSRMELVKEFLPQAVKNIDAAVDKVDRWPEVPSDMLRAYVISRAKTPEGVREDTLKLLENMAALGYHIYNPGGTPDIADRHDDSVGGYKDIAVKFVKDAPGCSDPVVREVLVLQPNMLRQKRIFDGFYDVVREANTRLLKEIRSDRRMTISRTRDKFNRLVMQLSARAYSKDNPSLSSREAAPSPKALSVEEPSNTINLTALQAFMTEARNCASAMLENGSFNQSELTNIHLDDFLRANALSMCSQWIETKHDIVTELIELEELINAHATEKLIAVRVHRILDWIRQDNRQMHELVMAVRSASQQNPAYGLACTLITESAANVLNPFNRAKEAADLLVSDTKC